MQSLMGYEATTLWSVRRFVGLESAGGYSEKLVSGDCTPELGPLPGHVFPRKYLRKAQPKGPLTVFGFDYFAVRAKELGVAMPRLVSYEGAWGSGEEYAYEILNFANGKMNEWEIWDAVSAEYGPVPVEMVLEYLKALEKIGVVEEVK